MTKKKMKRFLSFIFILNMLMPIIVPNDITYASILKIKKCSQINGTSVEGYDCNELQSDGNVNEEGCILDHDGLTVFDAWKQNMSKCSLNVENAPSEKQVVNEVVIFIRFAGQEETTYEERGGYDYIESLFTGEANSLKDCVDEYSWGQVEANTYFWPQNTDGTPKCYVDSHSVNYYLKQTDNNPEGYTTNQKSSRRKELLQNALDFAGADFLEQMGIENEPYNLVFVVPNKGSWNDLLWSHKSSMTVNGKSIVYNMITYNV